MGAVQIQVGQVLARGGDRGLVDAPQIVVDSGVLAPRGMPLLPPGPGRPGRRAGRRRGLAADGLVDLVAHRHHADASQALGFGLEAAAEPAGLVADLDDLDAPQLGVDAAATQPEQLAAAQPGADLGEEVVAVERAAGGQEAAELLRGEGPSALVAEDPVRIDSRLGASTSRTGLVGDQAFAAGRFQDAQQDGSARHHAAVAQLVLQLVCQRSTIEGVIWLSCRRPK
jgi:hypothetical protein